MTPRLLLLTGPAAGDVAAVFRKGMHTARLGWNFPYWDEVRDYWKALKIIELAARGLSEGFRPQSTYHDTAKAIHSLPGGSEWLVGLVLPDLPRVTGHHQWPGLAGDNPARLAILAPEPPPLLVERVRAWGGEVWRCDLSPTPEDYRHGTKPCHIDSWATGKDGRGGGVRDFWEDTWLEAVRAALEVWL